jgi:midasin (ATPase involved in ribosome maturation)
MIKFDKVCFLFQNLSQQSDVADLLGGFKPIDSLSICIPLYKEFEILFSKTFSMKVFLFSGKKISASY